MVLKMILFIMISRDTLYLSQEDAVKLALENNLILKSSRSRVTASKYGIKEARSAFFPEVSLQAGYRRVSLVQEMKSFILDSLVMTPGGAFIPVGHYESIPFGKEDNYSLSFNVSQPLFTWGNIIRGYKISLLNFKNKLIEDSVTRESLIKNVKELYIYALIAKEYYDLTLFIDEELRKHYESAKKKFENGSATELELLQAEVEYKTHKPKIEEAKKNYENILDLLKINLGIDTSQTIVLKDSLEGEIPKSLPEFCVEKRLDLKSLELQMEMLKLQKNIFKSSNLPSLFAGFNYLYQRPFGFIDEWKGYWVLNLGLSFPIFDGFKNISKAREIEANLKSLKYMYKFNSLSAYNSYMTAKRDYEIALKNLTAAKENLKLARKLYEMAKVQYEEGLISELDFIDAETSYFAQKVNYLNSLGTLEIKWLQLEAQVKGINNPQFNKEGGF